MALELPQAEIVGQERARAAIEFAVAMRHPGYHLFVMGPPGSGKRSLARRAIDAHVAHDGIRRYDWVYVNNFETPHQPIALRLAAGHGARCVPTCARWSTNCGRRFPPRSNPRNTPRNSNG